MYDAVMQIDSIQWDDGNRTKCQQHGVTLAEIEALFGSDALRVFPDPYPGEHRLRGVGRTEAGRYIFIVWTVRETDYGRWLRPISARFMHAKEIEHYEQDQG